jgi:hypothetical protein
MDVIKLLQRGTDWNALELCFVATSLGFFFKQKIREGRGLSLEPISWSVCHARHLWNESAATLEH